MIPDNWFLSATYKLSNENYKDKSKLNKMFSFVWFLFLACEYARFLFSFFFFLVFFFIGWLFGFIAYQPLLVI